MCSEHSSFPISPPLAVSLKYSKRRGRLHTNAASAVGGFLRILFFIFLFSLPSYSLFSYPPTNNVTAHNAALAPSLLDAFDPLIAKNGTIQFDFYGTDLNWVPISLHINLSLISASSKLLTIDPSVDNATSATHSPVLIFAWGNVSLPMEADDWDGDDCMEYQVNSTVNRSAIVTFSFGNISRTVSTTSNIIPVPAAVLEEMKNTSGKGLLIVELNTSFNFTYIVDDRRPSFEEGCSHHIINFSNVIELSDSKNWSVEGNRTLFFMRTPVLGEQWFRNNRFDSVVFSNNRIYRGEINADGNQTFSFRLYDFTITNDSYGVWYIQSVLLAPSEGVMLHSVYNAPAPIDPDNLSYHYLYEFNYSYEGVGLKILELRATSFFNDDYRFSREILSRMLSYSGNFSELGGPANETISRKSIAFQIDSIRGVTIAFGLIGILLVVLLANRFFKK
jgi:hypothetical protein